MKLVRILLALGLSAVPGLAATTPSKGGVLADCYKKNYYTTNVLSAVCIVGGVTYWANINLDLCLINSPTGLAFQESGHFSASCDCPEQSVCDDRLKCSCGSIDLNKGMYLTEQGQFACMSMVGDGSVIDAQSNDQPSCMDIM